MMWNITIGFGLLALGWFTGYLTCMYVTWTYAKKTKITTQNCWNFWKYPDSEVDLVRIN